MKQEFLQLAQKFNPKKHQIKGWYVSEKLDGIRCFWDGGVSRGILAHNIPYSNTMKDKKLVVSTGLWTRGGKVIHAPDFFLNSLPPMFLDGELFLARDSRQDLVSIVRKDIPDRFGWGHIRFMVFDCPSQEVFLKQRDLGSFNVLNKSADWYAENMKASIITPIEHPYHSLNTALECILSDSKYAFKLCQLRLNEESETVARAQLDKHLDIVTKYKGEGVMLRHPFEPWKTERSHNLLKVKKMSDEDGTVIGFRWGQDTDKGGKHLGKMGSLKIRSEKGITFYLSGFDDIERVIASKDPLRGFKYQGQDEPDPYTNYPKYFPVGSVITYQYRGKTKDGIPTEAKFWRERTFE